MLATILGWVLPYQSTPSLLHKRPKGRFGLHAIVDVAFFLTKKLPNSKTGLEDGDIIGISCLNKDIKKEHYATFEFFILNSLAVAYQSSPTLIESSSDNNQKNEKNNKICPDEKVDPVSDI